MVTSLKSVSRVYFSFCFLSPIDRKNACFFLNINHTKANRNILASIFPFEKNGYFISGQNSWGRESVPTWMIFESAPIVSIFKSSVSIDTFQLNVDYLFRQCSCAFEAYYTYFSIVSGSFQFFFTLNFILYFIFY